MVDLRERAREAYLTAVNADRASEARAHLADVLGDEVVDGLTHTITTVRNGIPVVVWSDDNGVDIAVRRRDGAWSVHLVDVDQQGAVTVLGGPFTSLVEVGGWFERNAAVPADWQPGQAVTLGNERMYDGDVWVVLQGHTTQADWTPPATPSLWVRKAAP